MTTAEDLLFNDTDTPEQPYSLPASMLMPPPASAPPIQQQQLQVKPFQRSLSFVKSGGHDHLIRSRSFIKPPGMGFRNNNNNINNYNNSQVKNRPYSVNFLYLSIWIDSKPIVWDSSCRITDNSD